MTRWKFPFDARDYEFTPYVQAQNWIGGEWRPARSGAAEDVINPRHGKAMGKVVFSGAADVEDAFAAATAALPAWKAMPIRERAQVLYRVKALMEANLDELSWLLSHENGKTIAQARGSVLKGIECVEMGASLQNMADGGQLDVSRGVNCRVIHEPLGVVAGIVPFNFPTMVPLWMLPQALVAGNTFILKPSEKVPYGAMRLAEIFQEAGLPDGVLNIVHGGKDAVETIIDHEGIKAVAFVGSTPVAKMLYARGAQTGKKVLGLGGAKNHLVVVPDASPQVTSDNIVASYTGCAGQRCMAASVLLAVGEVDHIVEQVAQRSRELVPGKDIGAIISQESRERILRYIDEAEAAGATILVDGRGATVPGSEGYWVGPTIIDGCTPEMACVREEIFGPVLSIIRTSTLDEALAIENASPFGNAACIYTTSGAVAERALSRFEAGMCGVNIGVPVPREPFAFGGWNDSKFGHGDMTGMDGFRFWTRPRKVTVKWELQSDQTWMS
ncbi:methylmalonate-semialdehyde dehydrogenase (CoA acylating) [Lujinxingia litoralis]|uniref:Methylmalonate-semialdehyde dehydrogenase (CoA acylating) n=1 Tax=Lujinxingia litoralis TaxID=2211119 RepID=A0A328CAX5_9DELT|nr:CoA-acylating methylmalonate-semialdehyde dehydrogenase [Lujinxingia litoralis]RAL25178.1 methylmalonate-semialdehyde dehydrogenase (CoA acylating) [Lujinxingia litoralis]